MKAGACLAGALVLALTGCLVTGEQNKGAKLPADLAWVPTEAAALVSVRPADLWKSDLGKGVVGKLTKDEQKVLMTGFARDFGLAPAEIERLTIVQPDLQSPPLLLIRSGKALEKKGWLKRLVPEGEEKKSGGRTYLAGRRNAAAFLGEREYALGTPQAIADLLEKPSKSDGGLAPAVGLAAKGHLLVAAANPSAVSKPDDDLHAELEPYRPLLKARHGTLTLDVGAKWSAKLQVAFAAEDDAKEGEKALAEARKAGRSLLGGVTKKLKGDKSEPSKAMAELVRLADAALEGAALKRTGKEVSADVGLKADSAKVAVLGAVMVRHMREAAARAQTMNNLKQIGLAMHGYHDVESSFPPQAVFDKDGKALLSWRVLVLPYIGQKELYDEFKLDEPWDSKHNKKLLAKMPALYRAPGDKYKNATTTFYLALVGKKSVFEGKEGIAIQDISDGTSNTIMVVETNKAVPWTKPDDVGFDDDKDAPELGGLYEGGFNAAFCDGSVRFITEKGKELKALITRNGGEVIRRDD